MTLRVPGVKLKKSLQCSIKCLLPKRKLCETFYPQCENQRRSHRGARGLMFPRVRHLAARCRISASFFGGQNLNVTESQTASPGSGRNRDLLIQLEHLSGIQKCSFHHLRTMNAEKFMTRLGHFWFRTKRLDCQSPSDQTCKCPILCKFHFTIVF